MKTSRALFILLLAGIAFGRPLRAQLNEEPDVLRGWRVDTVASSVAFHVTHLMVSTVTGRFSSFGGHVSGTAPDFSDGVIEGWVRLASVRTGDAERDADIVTPAFFNVAAHPEARFRSTGIRQTAPDRWVVDGALTLRGTTRPVQFQVQRRTDAAQPGDRYVAETEIDRFEWGLRFNRVLEGGRVVVSRTVRIELHIALERR